MRTQNCIKRTCWGEGAGGRLISPNDFNSVTRACWRASEWGSARKSLNPRARRSEGIVGLRALHVRLNLGSGDDWSERVTDGD
ncbi:jg14173 [Pararge aegeria aegeria]|uniref:Jg14173 protein n=1 Tax=Pararge aegeria aegeria TaxID=348720 RepID=A0A8S4SE34_9NEOP|nr:jg14173 [Pararge aegeria aegeria]